MAPEKFKIFKAIKTGHEPMSMIKECLNQTVWSCTSTDGRPSERPCILSSNTPPIDIRRSIETFPSRRRLVLVASCAMRRHPRACNTSCTSYKGKVRLSCGRSFPRAVAHSFSSILCSAIALDARRKIERLRCGRNPCFQRRRRKRRATVFWTIYRPVPHAELKG